MRKELDAAQRLDGLQHALVAVGEFPVRGHHVNAQLLTDLDHVLTARPQRGCRSLPGVAAIEQQSAGPRRPQPFHQRGEVCEAADLAVAPRGGREVKRSKSVGFGGARHDARCAQQMLAHQVWKAPGRLAHADIGAGLAKMRRQQLRMTVGEVQQTHVAERRQIVERLRHLRARRTERRTANRGGCERTQEFAAVH